VQRRRGVEAQEEAPLSPTRLSLRVTFYAFLSTRLSLRVSFYASLATRLPL